MDIYTIERILRFFANFINRLSFNILGRLLSRNINNFYEMFIFRFYKDRIYLKNLIYHMPLSSKNVLWVGCRRYNKFEYELLNLKDCDLTLIDIDPHVRKFAYGNTFICQDISNDDLNLNSQFDFIFMNGVFGDGLNILSDQEKALDNLEKFTNKKAFIIIGLNTGNHPCASNITINLLENYGYYCIADIKRAKHSFFVKYSQ